MADAAFIAIETDYEYVSKQLTDRTMRFMMDFNRIGGMLHNDILYIANELKLTAKEIAEQQGLRDTGNLIEGIKSYVFNGVIELRSTAYRIPMSGATDHDRSRELREHYYATKSDYADLPQKRLREIYNSGKSGVRKTDNRIHSILATPQKRNPDFISMDVQSYIFPQTSNKRGTIGGASALRQGHKNAYDVNHNIQYYGGHVEFGHRDRGGGFVEARPYLRPALRIVSAASTGQLAATMAQMLTGTAASFDGYRQPGLMFGRGAPEVDISQYIGKSKVNKDTHKITNAESTFFGNSINQYAIRRNYSVRHEPGMWSNVLKNDMNWGRRRRELDWARLGGHGTVYDSKGNKVKYSQEEIMKYRTGVSQRPWGRKLKPKYKNVKKEYREDEHYATSYRKAPKGQEYYLKGKNGKYTWALRKASKRQNIWPPTGKTKSFYKLSAFQRKKLVKYAKARKNPTKLKNHAVSMDKAFNKMKEQRHMNRLRENARRHHELRTQRRFGKVFTNRRNQISKLEQEINAYEKSKKMESDFLPKPFDMANEAGLSREAYLKSAQDYQIAYAKGQQAYSEYLEGYDKTLSEMKSKLKDMGG